MPFHLAIERLRKYTPKVLLAYDYEKNGEFCIIGLLCPSTQVYRDMDRSLWEIIGKDKEPLEELERLGMSLSEAEHLQNVCDGWAPGKRRHLVGTTHETKEQRYLRVLRWMEGEEQKRSAGKRSS